MVPQSISVTHTWPRLLPVKQIVSDDGVARIFHKLPDAALNGSKGMSAKVPLKKQ